MRVTTSTRSANSVATLSLASILLLLVLQLAQIIF
jgi:hypothetical protein